MEKTPFSKDEAMEKPRSRKLTTNSPVEVHSKLEEINKRITKREASKPERELFMLKSSGLFIYAIIDATPTTNFLENSIVFASTYGYTIHRVFCNNYRHTCFLRDKICKSFEF